MQKLVCLVKTSKITSLTFLLYKNVKTRFLEKLESKAFFSKALFGYKIKVLFFNTISNML